jgi:hypothetical protein
MYVRGGLIIGGDDILDANNPYSFLKRNGMDGEKYYLAAIFLTDRHPGVQFREMLNHDANVGQAVRLYFQEDLRDLPLYGWNTFCLKMEETGNKKWLAKIKALDNDVILGHLEQQLMYASRDGKTPNRNLLEATVKALQGVTALTKISAENDGAVADGIEVRFIPSLETPIEPETWEELLDRLNLSSENPASNASPEVK